VGTLSIPFEFQVDQLSLLMLLIITGVGTLIHIYSMGYMSHDAGFGKFFAFLNLFVFFMLILVLGANFTVLFIGWEGVGLCSYLLIGFWNQKNSYGDAARKAFIMNRIGDLGFLVGIFLLIQNFNTTNYQSIFQAIASGNVPENIGLIAFCLFIGAMGGPYPCFGLDSRSHNGDGGNLHGHSCQCDFRIKPRSLAFRGLDWFSDSLIRSGDWPIPK
jgi:NADH-quinone oxidoreductase subunit L